MTAIYVYNEHRGYTALDKVLCRVISLTEQRGYRQVDILLRHPLILQDRGLTRIFHIIKRDEPRHWAPYDAWLARAAAPLELVEAGPS